MEELLSAIDKLVVLLSPRKIQGLVNRLDEIEELKDNHGMAEIFSTPLARASFEAIWLNYKRIGISSEKLSGMLLAASFSRRKALNERRLEFVWTGPKTQYAVVRRTEQVLLDLINSSQNQIFLVSFVAYNVSSIVNALNSACSRGVKIDILVEASSDNGGSLNIDSPKNMKDAVNAANVYIWKKKEGVFVDGRVHAKIAIADGLRAFITSANLTSYALEKNMEAGILIEDHQFITNIQAHFQSLIDADIVKIFNSKN